MNCQNCHLSSGTKLFANNYSAILSTYPRFRPRSGSVENLVKRITDCFERSMNGTAPDSTSREMQAMIAYIHWIGRGVPKGAVPKGASVLEVKYLDRPANPQLGQVAYHAKCSVCHQQNGLGKLQQEGAGYLYPPLWGPSSYNTAAGMYRLSRLAGFIKGNMPYGTSYLQPVLTDEEAWDIAAYINSMERPVKTFNGDWPDPAKKPIDHPFGPYADPFPEEQHKYGPFQPIKDFYASKK
jgi:thiosulfate dehydrogenase